MSFLVIVGLLTGYSIWAENNVEDNIPNIKPKWGKHKSKDTNQAGGLTTISYIEVDIDYPNEPGIQLKDGIEYESYARGSAGFRWGSHGTIDIDTYASKDSKEVRKHYSGWVWKSLRSKHFREYTGDAAQALNHFDEDDVKRNLKYTRAKVVLTREVDEDDYYHDENYESTSNSHI